MPKNSILIILAPENFRDEEFFEPKQVLEKEGFTITIASKGVKTAKGKLGAEVEINKDISAINVNDYGAIVFIGGNGASVYFEDAQALNIAKEAYESKKIIAAICIAPSILANAGILEGKNATCYSSQATNIEDQGAKYTGNDVQVDGKIITANGPKAAQKFGEEIANQMKAVKEE